METAEGECGLSCDLIAGDPELCIGRFFRARCEQEEMAKLIIQHLKSDSVTTGTEKMPKTEGRALFVIGHCSSHWSVRIGEELCTPADFFVYLYRLYRCHRNERVSVLSPADQLVALQLVLARRNQRLTGGEFDVEVSDVLVMLDRIIQHKLLSSTSTSSLPEDVELQSICQEYNDFMQSCNACDWPDVFLAVIKERKVNSDLDSLIKRSSFLGLNIVDNNNSVEKQMLLELCKGKDLFDVTVCLSLDDSFTESPAPGSTQVTVTSCSVDDIFLSKLPMAIERQIFSASVIYTDLIFVGYLELLVNSCNELALARVINIPNRGIDHKAFTNIKHVAEKKGMSMYQTISSFIMRIRLGGRGYAPASNCPLTAQTKGLAEFTDFMHKLQTVIEEETQPECALKKVCNIVKGAMLRGSTTETQLKRQNVETSAQRIIDEIVHSVAMTANQFSVCKTPSRSASDGGASLGRRTLRIARSMLDRRSSMPLPCSTVDILTDVFSSQSTPIRFPSILSKFRSPELENNEVVKPLVERLKSKSIKPKVYLRKVKRLSAVVQNQSCFDWAPSESLLPAPMTVMNFIQSKTIVHSSNTREMSKSTSVILNDRNTVAVSSIVLQHPVYGVASDDEQSLQSACDDKAEQSNDENASHEKKIEAASSIRKRKAFSEMETNVAVIRQTSRQTDAEPPITKKPINAKKSKPASRSASKAKLPLPQIKGQAKIATYFRL